MAFRVFFPPAAGPGAGDLAAGPPPTTPGVPALLFLSGLTCTPANASEKAATALAAAAAAGLAFVFPDTSPRGLGVAGEDADWDLGTGAGFYVDATAAPWVKEEGADGQGRVGYRMFSYVTSDLLDALAALGGAIDTARLGVTGHSMGGHGALVAGLRRPDLFASISAFSPIAAPSACPWGRKAFSAYLGPDPAAWAAWDGAALARAYVGPPRTILVDVGDADEFLRDGQLRCGELEAAVAAGGGGGGGGGGEGKKSGLTITLRTQPGYDHSYFFIASFAADHVAHHAAVLVGGEKE